MRVWDEKLNFQELVTKDKDIAELLSAGEINDAFSTDTYLRNIDTIFDRVFAKKENRSEPTAAGRG
jgi:adenylosuccinate lyase